jgi:hypothetical protein
MESVQDDGDMTFPEPDAFTKPKTEAPVVFSPSFGDDSGGLGGLPDLDAMSAAFSSGAPSDEPRQAAASWQADVPAFDLGGGSSPLDLGDSLGDSALEMPQEFQPQETGDLEKVRTTGNKPQPLEGDFNPQQLAQGIRTVLSKE